MASPLTLSGLASGLDTDALITRLVAAEKARNSKLTQQQSAQQKRQTQLNGLQTKLKTLQEKAGTAQKESELSEPKATSSKSDVVGVKADGTAAAGSYDVRVAALAQGERSYSGEFSAKDTAGLFGTGTLRISVSGTDHDIAVTSSDTLETLATKINGVSGGFQASVFATGTGFRLQVAGQNTGTQNAIEFTETGTSLGMTEAVAASDAKVSIDGFVVSSATNSISNVLTGVTLELESVSEGATFDSGTNTITGGTATQIKLERDASTLKTSMTDIVTAYNDVVKELKNINGTSADPTLLSIESKLRAALRTEVGGLSESLNTLAELGIATNKDGTIRIDDKTFDKKAADDFAGAVNLLATIGTRKGVAEILKTSIDDVVKSNTGMLATKQKSITSTLKTLADRIDVANDRIDSYEARLRKQFTAMEQALTKLNQSAGSITSIM